MISPDGKHVAVVCGWEMKVIEVGTGKAKFGREFESSRSCRNEFYHDSRYCPVFSPDGKNLLASSDGREENCFRVWDVGTGRERDWLRRTQAWPSHFAFSADGKTVASACPGRHVIVGGGEDSRKEKSNANVKLWGLPTGNVLWHLDPGVTPSFVMLWTPDGKSLITSGPENTLKVWDVATRNERLVLKGHESRVEDATLSPDGKLLAADSGETARLWDLTDGKELALFPEHSNMGGDLQFSPDGKTLAVFLKDHSLCLWDVPTRKPRLRLRAARSVGDHCRFSPDGRTLATWSRWDGDEAVRLWDPATGDVRAVLSERDGIRGVIFAPDGRTLATVCADRTIKLWDPITGQEWLTLRGCLHEIQRLVFSPDSKTLAVGTAAGTVLLRGGANPPGRK